MAESDRPACLQEGLSTEGVIDRISSVIKGLKDGSANSSFGHCGSGMEDNIEVSYFRLRM